MSIQDDYWDIQHKLKKRLKDSEASKTFEHFARWAFDLEESCDKLTKRNTELETTVKTMLSISET